MEEARIAKERKDWQDEQVAKELQEIKDVERQREEAYKEALVVEEDPEAPR